jgi:hypothetical protein
VLVHETTKKKNKTTVKTEIKMVCQKVLPFTEIRALELVQCSVICSSTL